MKTRLYCALFLTFVLLGCSDKSQHDVDSIQSLLLAASKADLSKNQPSDLSGIWRSESTGSLLLVGTNHRVMILSVSDLGKMLETDKNQELLFEKSMPSPPSGRLFFGTNTSGKIERVQDDYREVFHKVGQ